MACLAAPLVGTPATAAPPDARSGVVRKHVDYGSKAVRVAQGKRAVISFDGRRGDIVSLSGVAPAQLRLFRKGHRVPQTWVNGGYYRLPRTARFSFRVRADEHGSQTLGLVKARVHRLEVDGKAVTTPRTRRGYVDLAAVRLRGGDRVTVDDGRDDNRLYLPDRRYASGWGRHLLLRPGHDLRVSDDDWPIGREVVTGTTLVRVASGHRVTAASAVEVAVRPNGTGAPLPPERRAQREYVFTFDGGVDDLVYLESQTGPSVTGYATLLDRWTTTPVDSPVSQVEPVSPAFVLPTAGTHEISTVSDALGRGTSATVRLRTGIRVADLTPDGPAVDFTLDGSGTRVYALATAIGQRLESTSSDLGAGETWIAELSPRDPWSCGADPYGPLGCGDNGYAFVSDTRPAGSSNGLNMEGPVVVATPAAGTTGTVSIRLRSEIVPRT
jgi:hypothetical protein